VPPSSEKGRFFLGHGYSEKVKFWEALKVISVIRYCKESLNKYLKVIVQRIFFFISLLQHYIMVKQPSRRLEL